LGKKKNVPVPPPQITSDPGFCYWEALRELVAVFGYAKVAERCDFFDERAVLKAIKQKQIPDHPRGERIYTMYHDFFRDELGNPKKPPNVPLGTLKNRRMKND
jgi:hypothetical protein